MVYEIRVDYYGKDTETGRNFSGIAERYKASIVRQEKTQTSIMYVSDDKFNLEQLTRDLENKGIKMLSHKKLSEESPVLNRLKNIFQSFLDFFMRK